MSGFSEITSAMYHDAQATIATQAAQIETLTKALEFYRDAWKFKSGTPLNPGLTWKPKPELLDDCGNIARAALSNTGKK